MSAEIRFYLDEQVPSAVASGLRRRGIDVTTTADEGMLSASDQEQLDFAARNRRVMVTQDDDFLRLHAEGTAHAGIAYCRQGTRTIGQMLETLVLIFELMTLHEMGDQVVYL